MSVSYIAILGFGRECSDLNHSLAYGVGAELVSKGFGIAAGNVTSTFHHAFEGAKSVRGTTLAIVEEKLRNIAHSFCDELRVVSDVDTKHKKLAELCVGAIIIGGGPGTRNVASKFLELKKPVVAIEGSGGIVSDGLEPVVVRAKSAKESVDKVVGLLKGLG
ncbi:MAG: hypothetical protein QNI91_13650 [Arenicellales bacterium]|nr:hypothetical protein [Arenicellales bacterium]